MRKICVLPACIILLATSVGALCPGPRPRLLCAEYFQEDAVVTAKLLRTRHITPANENEDDYYLYTMQAQQVLRGRIGASFRVIETNGSGRAQFEWRKGESYLLFISYMKKPRAWTLDACGSSGPLDGSAEILKGIDRLQKGGDGGTIRGNVVQAGGVTVLVTGKQAAFKTTTDKEGNFEVHVPAGVYSARVILEGRRLEPDILSYEDPGRFRVSNGGCAQLQFQFSDDSQGKRLNRMRESPNEVFATNVELTGAVPPLRYPVCGF